MSVDYTLQAAKSAKTVIVQVNPQMPVTFGGTIHISDVTAVVEHDAPLLTLEPPVIGDVELAIGANCAGLIRDGDTLQLGIGAIPDAVLRFLGDKKIWESTQRCSPTESWSWPKPESSQTV
ncbi:MAG: hypothetical protein ACLR8Q_01290 [[Ruminococcus] lactaris]|uniref:hypothetical protein n=1 Tax=[Ruminococcus] lactaris TaxID=46228 RepID=UPI0039A1A6E2